MITPQRRRLPALPGLQHTPTTDPAQGALISRLRARDPRYQTQPEPGYWLMPAVKGGHPMPACIVWVETTCEPGEPDNKMERSRFLAAFLAGAVVDLDRVALWKKDPISAQEYRFQMADLAHAKEHRPTDPKARPYERLRLGDINPADLF